jgi:hypothetical protein
LKHEKCVDATSDNLVYKKDSEKMSYSYFNKTGLTALLVGRSRDRSPVVSLGIFSEATDGTMCPAVDSASKNEYQENSWE